MLVNQAYKFQTYGYVLQYLEKIQRFMKLDRGNMA